MTEQFIKNVVSCPNPEDNGGESVLFTTTVITDEDVVCLESEIMLMSYGNCCAMTLGSANLSPKFLRNMADDIEKAVNEAKQFIKENNND